MARGEKSEGSESSGVDLAKLTDIGKRITRLASSKDSHALCELLKEASDLFLRIQQQPGNDVLSALKPSMDTLVLPSLLKHKDKDVQVLVASCISEILRIVAPDAPFSDEIWEEIFALIVATFKGLNDVANPYFQVRLHILCTVASVRSCIVMLNIECNDLIHEMFQTFFATVREKPTQMMAAMKKIMCLILLENEEEIPQPLIEVLLTHLLVGRKGVSKSAYILAGVVFEECANHIKLYVEAFLKSVLMEGKSAKSRWRDVYHDLIFEIYIRAPSLVTHLIPKLKDELLAEKIDVRVKALKLLGRLFSSRKGVAENFNKLFSEYLKRFNDKSVDVRLGAVECSKQCLLVNSSSSVAEELLAALSEHIQDVDDGVRVQVVGVICNYAVSFPKKIPVQILKRVAERLRDTEMHVRQETLQRLTGVYQAFCLKRVEGSTVDMESFNWIPSKLIRCCFDKDCKELRAQAMELVFSEQLFPEDFPVEEKVKCWISFFSVFDENDVKALQRILQQKQRLHNEMHNYLALQQKGEDEKADENAKALLICCKNMGLSFMDSTSAESELHALSLLKDGKLLKYLTDLLDPKTTDSEASTLRKNILQQIDDQHPRHEFLKILSVKCSYLLFGREHMKALVSFLEDYKKVEDEKLMKASMGLLVEFARYFPSLLEGLEENIMELLKDDREFLKEGSVQIFGSLQGQVTEDSSSVDLLAKLCVEGSRKQVKYAVKALAAISGDSGLKLFSTLYRKLLDLLDSGVNLPTVLQSLGCIVQYDASVFETSEEVLVNFLTKDLFRRDSHTLDEEPTSVSETTLLKIFGLKALVKSFLPRKEDQVVPRFKGLSGILLKFVEYGEVSEEIKSRRIDKDQLRLAAGKSVLLLSKKYDSQISAQLYHAAVLLSMDSCDYVKNGFLSKLKKLLKKQALPEKYGCALALSLSGNADNDFLTEVKQELSAFVESSRREARLKDITVAGQGEEATIIHCPEYVLFYLVHALAQVADFPSLSEGGPSVEKLNPFFRQLSVYIWALLNDQEKFVHDVKEDLVNYALILSIFRKMKLADDKFDALKTENTRILCDIGIVITKDLAGVEIPEYKDADKIPLPSSIYEVPENEDEANKVDGSHLPGTFKEGDAFSQMKFSQPFLVDMVSKKRKRTDSRDTSEEEKSPYKLGKSDDISVDGELHPRKQVKTSEDEDQDASPSSPVSDENVKDSESERSRNDKNRRSDDDLKLETVGSSSSKRGRGGRISKEKSTLKKRATAKSSGDVSISAETDIDEHEAPLTDGSSKKSVKISIKSPKPPEEEISEEDSVEAKKHVSKKINLKKSSTKQEGSAEAKRTRGKKDVDSHGPESQALGSPRGTPKRSAKKRLDSKVDMKLEPKDLVGSRIEVWWPLDKRFYTGRIEKYDAKQKMHKVVYDDGDVEVLKLEKERWRLLEDTEDEIGSPSTPASSELGMDSKRRNSSSQTKRKSRGGSSSKRSLESSSKRKSKHGEDVTPKQLGRELEKDGEEEAGDYNAHVTTEDSAQGQMSDGEKTPSPTVSKVQAKLSGQSTQPGKRPIGRPRKHPKVNAAKGPEIAQEHPAFSTDSKDSKDSDDVPLDEWKSSRKKARLQE